MVIHLKRFSQVRMWRNKLNTFVDFPISGLDMTDYVIDAKDDDRLVYDLYAIDNHYGDMGGGHYTAYAQNAIDKHWYDFDDTSVTKIDERRIKTSAAYVLFYKRRRRSNVD
ncbi:Putative Ubiquitin carboxyl-terminal hydrolase [Rhizopus microsporus]|nr:Putative Ubiquitin carboxyl-terminal hydrolase [Rhizopus microsporus]